MNAYVLEWFIRFPFASLKLSIDNKQARCFADEFRLFDSLPRKEQK